MAAEQIGTEKGGEFIGGNSTVGVFQYQTQLTKVEKLDNAGMVIGYE